MIYVLCTSKVLELDIKNILKHANLPCTQLSSNLSVWHPEPDDILIISHSIVSKNNFFKSISDAPVIVICSLSYKSFLEENYLPNFHYLSMPIDRQELLEIINSLPK